MGYLNKMKILNPVRELRYRTMRGNGSHQLPLIWESIYQRLKSLASSNGIKLLLACTVVFGVSYFYLLYYRNAFYDLTADEGYIIYGAKRVLDGQILYKDFFQYFPPGDFYLLAFVFKLFGYSFIIAREAAVIIDSMTNALLFYLSYKAIKSWYAILSPLFFLILGFPNWMQYSHYWSSMLFLFMSLVLFLAYLEHRKDLYLYFTGLLVGLTGLFLQTPAVYAIILICFNLIAEERQEQGFVKRSLLFLTGVVIPLILAFGYLAFKGAFFDFIKEQYFMSKVYAEAATFNPMALYFHHFSKYSVIFLVYTGIAILSGIALILFRKRLSNPEKIILTGYIILFFTSSSRMDFEHMLINSAMLFIIVLFPLKWFLDAVKNKNRLLYKTFYYIWHFVSVALIVWAIYSMKKNIENIETVGFHIEFDGTPVWTFNQKEAYEIKEFFPKAEQMLQGEKYVFVYPDGALIYVMMNLHNPVFIDWVPTLTGMPDEGAYGFYREVQDLILNKTKYVIYCSWPRDYINAVLSMEKKQYRVNAIDEYINSHYTQILRVNNLLLYKKR